MKKIFIFISILFFSMYSYSDLSISSPESLKNLSVGLSFAIERGIYLGLYKCEAFGTLKQFNFVEFLRSNSFQTKSKVFGNQSPYQLLPPNTDPELKKISLLVKTDNSPEVINTYFTLQNSQSTDVVSLAFEALGPAISIDKDLFGSILDPAFKFGIDVTGYIFCSVNGAPAAGVPDISKYIEL